MNDGVSKIAAGLRKGQLKKYDDYGDPIDPVPGRLFNDKFGKTFIVESSTPAEAAVVETDPPNFGKYS